MVGYQHKATKMSFITLLLVPQWCPFACSDLSPRVMPLAGGAGQTGGVRGRKRS